MSIVDGLSYDKVCERVIKVLSQVSGIPVENVKRESSFEDLELDSLSRIELLVEIEREFDLELPEETDDESLIQKIHSVEETTRMVMDYLDAKKV